MVKRNIIKGEIFHEGDVVKRAIITSGPKAAQAYFTGSVDLRPAFIGVSKIDDMWWSVYKVCGEYTTVEAL